jgi:hypothetical protein
MILSYDRIMSEPITPTEYRGFQKAYDFFNGELFDNLLPHVLVTLQRHAKAKGYFSPDRFTGRIQAKLTAHETGAQPGSIHRLLHKTSCPRSRMRWRMSGSRPTASRRPPRKASRGSNAKRRRPARRNSPARNVDRTPRPGRMPCLSAEHAMKTAKTIAS